MTNQIPIQKKVQRILECTQILYQNDEISAEQKNTIANTCLSAIMNPGNLRNLTSLFKSLEYGTMFPDIVRELVNLTSC